MASRSLEALAPTVAALAVAFVKQCHVHGLEVLIYCTLRSNIEQAALYAHGRSAPGPMLTNCKPGDSMHNPGADGMAWAFDAVPMVHGVALWDDQRRLDLMGRCGEAVGLEWAGRWGGAIREKVHFQKKRGEL